MSLQSFIQDFKDNLKKVCSPGVESHARNLDGSEFNVEQHDRWVRDSSCIVAKLVKCGLTINSDEFLREYGKRIRKLWLVETREIFDEKDLLSSQLIYTATAWLHILRQVVMDKEVSAYIEEHHGLFPTNTLAYCGIISSGGFENHAMSKLVVEALSRMVLREQDNGVKSLTPKKCGLPECGGDIPNKRLAYRALYCSDKCRKAAANRRAK